MFIQFGKGLGLYDADMEDVGQATEIAGIIPTGKAPGCLFLLRLAG
jgi:hypothetical protein